MWDHLWIVVLSCKLIKICLEKRFKSIAQTVAVIILKFIVHAHLASMFFLFSKEIVIIDASLWVIQYIFTVLLSFSQAQAGGTLSVSAAKSDTLFIIVTYPSSLRQATKWRSVVINFSVWVIYVLSVVSVTTAHAQYIKNKKGHFSADAELEDLGGASHRVPKKKGPQVVKF